jgi:hypothetical protein
MDNYEAIAYVVVALHELQIEKKEVNPEKLKARMLYLMDMNSEAAIYKKAKNKGLV